MSRESTSAPQPVLLLGPERTTRRFAGALLVLGYRGLFAADASAALPLLASCETPVRAGIVASALADPPSLGEIHAWITTPLVWILAGARPDPASATALRQHGVRFVLSDACAAEELRFVLAEAHHAGDAVLRAEARVPASLRARVYTKTGERLAVVCNLSSDGAFLATPRPTLRGGRIEIELPLPALTIRTPVDVLWNNVPGNMRRANAPIGMGVRFVELPAAALQALREYLDACAACYRL